jgi:hypothetical protein
VERLAVEAENRARLRRATDAPSPEVHGAFLRAQPDGEVVDPQGTLLGGGGLPLEQFFRASNADLVAG